MLLVLVAAAREVATVVELGFILIVCLEGLVERTLASPSNRIAPEQRCVADRALVYALLVHEERSQVINVEVDEELLHTLPEVNESLHDSLHLVIALVELLGIALLAFECNQIRPLY